jgi:hypothetical protein
MITWSIARQRLGKLISTATDARMEELLEVVFSVRSVLSLYMRPPPELTIAVVS